MRRRTAWSVALLAVILLGGCGGASEPTSRASTAANPSRSSQLSGALTVLAPSTVKGALDQVKAAFESVHPGVMVRLSYGHVPALLSQISEGVPADVLVSPDQSTAQQLQAKGLAAGAPIAVARTRLVLVVPAGNPGKVVDLRALGDSRLTVAVCAPELPCGKLTSGLASKAGVTVSADSQEPGGSPGVVTKAATGEIDVGVAFATDLAAAGTKVTAIPIDDALGGSGTVTAATLTSAENPLVATQFLTFLSSPEGRALFTRAGFVAP